MTYIPDLTPYDYHTFPRHPKLLAIGWLDSDATYSKGVVGQDIINRLARLTAKPVNLTRGYHFCQFCKRELSDKYGEQHARGNGEIRVLGANDIIYAAPVLISHYVEKHQYGPPAEFLEAVSKLPEIAAKIAIIAALERELHPLVKTWGKKTIQHEGRTYVFYESNYAIAICGGIGAESARRAAEAAIKQYSPGVLVSAGVAGALVPELKTGDTIFPAMVVDTADGSRHTTAIVGAPLAKTALGRTVLASYPNVTVPQQKHQLAKSYSAHAVDMEAAALARAAQKYELPFVAVKTISDELDFEMPEMSCFIRNGEFRTAAFVAHVIIRPWFWLRVLRLARNTKLASENLCAWLRESALTNTIVTGTPARAGTLLPPQSQ